MNKYHSSEDGVYMPEFGYWGKEGCESRFRGEKILENWSDTSSKAITSPEKLTPQIVYDRLTEKINILEGEIQELKGKDGKMRKIKVNPRALDELFEIFDSTPPKIKDKKEFEKWVEEGE